MVVEGRACVLEEPGAAAVVREVTVDPPGPGEVMVRLAASGVCHTDLTVKMLNGSGMKFPIVLGHEGAGHIEQVGEGVTGLAVGDPVVIAYRAPCEQCPACRRGDPRHCYMALRPGQRIKRKSDGALCSQVLRCGTFSTHTVVHSKAAIKMPKEMPLDKACLIACGVVTGVGATVGEARLVAHGQVPMITAYELLGGLVFDKVPSMVAGDYSTRLRYVYLTSAERQTIAGQSGSVDIPLIKLPIQ